MKTFQDYLTEERVEEANYMKDDDIDKLFNKGISTSKINQLSKSYDKFVTNHEFLKVISKKLNDHGYSLQVPKLSKAYKEIDKLLKKYDNKEVDKLIKEFDKKNNEFNKFFENLDKDFKKIIDVMKI